MKWNAYDIRVSTWERAVKAWKLAIEFAGFESIEVAYTQGWYTGYETALKELEELAIKNNGEE